MGTQYRCQNQLRSQGVRQHPTLDGIDYLEVLDQEAPGDSPRQRTLLVRFLKPVSALTRENVRIDGGVRVTPVRVLWAFPAPAIPPSLITAQEQTFFSTLLQPDHVLVVRTDSSGDFSTYRLSIVASSANPNATKDLDSQLSEVKFSFKVECPSDFDCKPVTECPPEVLPEPEIDYLAKDYASFRRLMLDRLAVIMPDWRERNPADLQVALVELLAYVGDHLSYFQDAVATEAYLGTVRKRTSVRRHARLLDYPMHDGCNARAWVCFEVKNGGDGVTLKKRDAASKLRTRLLTRCVNDPVVPSDDWEKVLAPYRPQVFELMHDLTLYKAHNTICFYTWGDEQCCLPKGASRATLCDDAAHRLSLRVGDVLIFEEQIGPDTGAKADADRTHRHAARLTRVSPEATRAIINGNPVITPGPLLTDPLTGQAIVEIAWHPLDALPFPLCISTLVKGQLVPDVSVAHGNVALVDHGQTIENEKLQPPEVPEKGRYRPYLKQSGITFNVPYDDDAARKQAASEVIAQSPQAALPAVELDENGNKWKPRRELLNSDRFAREFVLELDDEGRSQLRFGDDVLGMEPDAGTSLTPVYRIGIGRVGNVGAEALAHLVPTQSSITSQDTIARVWNPMPAQGGTYPESLDEVRLYAPEAFRTQERAVTEADYAGVAQRHPEVQKAAATTRWTGSWYTVFVTIDRKRGLPVDADFEKEMVAFMERYRMAGYDLEINVPVFVPLDVLLSVCVKPGYFRSQLNQALVQTFSNRVLPDGTLGFFHPDNFTFNQPVYLSQIYQAAMKVAGVDSVVVTRFQRWGNQPNQEIENGVLTVGTLEVIRLDSDPNFPENGRIEFEMLGGL